MIIKTKHQINEKYIMKKKELSQKQNNRCIDVKELFRSYVELENKLKTMEKNFKTDSQ